LAPSHPQPAQLPIQPGRSGGDSRGMQLRAARRETRAGASARDMLPRLAVGLLASARDQPRIRSAFRGAHRNPPAHDRADGQIASLAPQASPRARARAHWRRVARRLGRRLTAASGASSSAPVQCTGAPEACVSDDDIHIEEYDHPAGGWGSLKSLGSILLEEHVALAGARVLMHQNKPDGYACVSCAWAKPAAPHRFEFCENGAKATAWEITAKRAPPEFFLEHTARALEGWRDHDLEGQGRLTAPLRWDAATDCYVEVSWESALEEIARELRALEPSEAVFYTSGRASLEASYLYQLMVRMYGCNNLPDSSNMCHESTSVALPKTIGASIGTVTLEDFDQTDCIFFFGQNVGTSSPRMLHQLQDARRRNVPIITFNPLREPGLVSFANPQSPTEMLTAAETQISTQYHQVRTGGDAGAILGLCKALIESDDDCARQGIPRVLDTAFIAEHTHGFEAFAACARSTDWFDIERASGLGREALTAAAAQYARARAVIAIYGM